MAPNKKGLLIFVILSMFLLSVSTITAQETPKLKFTTQDFRPFSYLENNRVAGPAVDIIQAVCKKIRIDCSFKLYPWPRAQALVKDGSANGMFVIGWNEKRSQWLYFSPPILNTEYGFFVKDDNPLQFESTADIDHYRIGVFGPSNTSNTLEKIKAQVPGITIDLTPDDEACFKKLSRGRVQAVFSNKDVGFALIRKLGIKNVRYAGRYKKLNYYIGFSMRYNDRQIISRFNNAFIELHKQGEIKKILDTYHITSATLE